MNESFSLPTSLPQTLHIDKARVHVAQQGVSLPSGAYMSQQDSLHGGEASLRMRDMIAGLAQALVDHPETVSVEVIPEAASTVLRLRVASSDIGKVIGKQGRTARSIRTILSAASMKLQHRFSLDIVEEGIAQTSSANKDCLQE